MDLKKYFSPLIKWWWLLLAATIIAAVSSFLIVRRQPPVYQAKSTLMIGRIIQDPNPSSAEFFLSQQLAQAYADIAQRDPIQKAVKDSLGLSTLPNYTLRVSGNSSLIDILVVDTDRTRAQAVSNELAVQLIKESPSGVKPADQDRQKFISDQLDKLQAQISQTQTDLDKLIQKLGSLNSAKDIADTQVQITAQQDKLTSLRANYADMLSSTQSGATNSLTLLEPASVPIIPIGPNKVLIVGLSSIIGLFLAVLAAYGIEALDNTMKTPDEFKEAINLPILGSIADMPKGVDKKMYVMDDPVSLIAESFRMLRVNLEFLSAKKPLHVILVSSSAAADGKSTVAANLAASLAQAKKRVILVDADFRNPSLHKMISGEIKGGLCDICLGSVGISESLNPLHLENLKVIPAGLIPPDPTELLGSPRMAEVLNDLIEISDYVVIDCPPMFLSDTILLSGKADGILLVARPGVTHKRDLIKAVDQLHQAQANILGVVLNRTQNHPKYYKGYKKYETARSDARVKV